jgi:hypothetical protein
MDDLHIEMDVLQFKCPGCLDYHCECQNDDTPTTERTCPGSLLP